MGNEQSKSENNGAALVAAAGRKRFKSHDDADDQHPKSAMRVSTSTKRRVVRVRRNQSFGPAESRRHTRATSSSSGSVYAATSTSCDVTKARLSRSMSDLQDRRASGGGRRRTFASSSQSSPGLSRGRVSGAEMNNNSRSGKEKAPAEDSSCPAERGETVSAPAGVCEANSGDGLRLMIEGEGCGDEASSDDSFRSARPSGEQMGNSKSASVSSAEEEGGNRNFASCTSTPEFAEAHMDARADPLGQQQSKPQGEVFEREVDDAEVEEADELQADTASLSDGKAVERSGTAEGGNDEQIEAAEQQEEAACDGEGLAAVGESGGFREEEEDSDDSSDCCSYVLSDAEQPRDKQEEEEEESCAVEKDEGVEVREVEAECRQVEAQAEEVASQTQEGESQSPVVESETPEVDSQSPEVESETPEIESQTQEIESETPEIESQAQEIDSQTLEIECETPEIESQAQEIESETLEIESETPEIESQAQEIESQTLEIESETPEVQSQAQEIESQTLEVESRTLEIESETSEIESQAQEIESHTQGVESQTEEIKASTEDIDLETEKPSAQIEEAESQTQEVEFQTEEIEPQTLEVESHTPEMESQTKKIESQTQKVESESKEVESQTQGVQAQTQEIESRTEEIEPQTQEVKSQTEEIESQTQEIDSKTQELESENKEAESQTQEIEAQTQEVKSQTEEIEAQNDQIEDQAEETQPRTGAVVRRESDPPQRDSSSSSSSSDEEESDMSEMRKRADVDPFSEQFESRVNSMVDGVMRGVADQLKEVYHHKQQGCDDDDVAVVVGERYVERCENCSRVQSEARLFLRGYMLAHRREEEIRKGSKWLSKQKQKGSLVSGSSVQNSVTSSSLQLDPSAGATSVSASLAHDASVNELREALNCVEEKYRKAMVQNAQLDNERTQLTYHTQQLRDLLEEQDDQFYRLKKEHRDKCQEVEKQKRLLGVLNKRNNDLKYALQQRDQLIEQQGVVVIGDVTSDDVDDDDDQDEDRRSTYALITPEAARMLESAGDGSLDVRLRNLADEKEKLHEEIRTLRKEANERERNDVMNGVTSLDGTSSPRNSSLNEMEILEIQREANKLVGEYKVKVQKYEQDVAGLQANVSRMETQIQRHKQTSEQLEKNEDEMRAEKRRLQRDLRTALDRIEEHEITITHLERRLERARAARNQT